MAQSQTRSISVDSCPSACYGTLGFVIARPHFVKLGIFSVPSIFIVYFDILRPVSILYFVIGGHLAFEKCIWIFFFKANFRRSYALKAFYKTKQKWKINLLIESINKNIKLLWDLNSTSQGLFKNVIRLDFIIFL